MSVWAEELDEDGMGGEGGSIDLDELIGNSETSTIIHARWVPEVCAVEDVCNEFKPNPFRKGFCINCQKRHPLDAAGQVQSTLEYTHISHQSTWQPQLPTNPDISTSPDAVVGVGRDNKSHSQRNFDVDLAEVLHQRREIMLELQNIKCTSSKDEVRLSPAASIRLCEATDPSTEDWL
ncbi:hypothetical protein ACHHYP_20021 [Achlya hypogyna]|uniref:Uncharacterized protein n=1 Tax=Achlya hypogyna TaxID=1202772 RepID=A0A1V9ZAL6_ACHHY|nr:hypothetical protein ACHHYP_20021 [Achlya hypogyna]